MATLRFKKDGTPFVDFRAGGKRHRPEFLTINDAQKFMTLANADAEEAYRFWQESITADQNGRSLLDTVQSFKKDYCSKRKNSNDMRRIMDRFVAHVLAQRSGQVKDVALANVGIEDFEGFQSELVKSGITNTSVNRYFSTVKTFWGRCVRAGYVERDFSRLIKPLAEVTTKREAWKDEDTPKLIAELERRCVDPVLLDIARSMPFVPFGPIDFKRLKWRMVDFDRGVIETFRMKGRGMRKWAVPMLLGLQALFLEIRERQKVAGRGRPEDFVYLNEVWESPDTTWISKSLERARKAVGITTVPYASRHRIISLIEQRAGLRAASQFGGHASVSTTEKHYVVSSDDELRNRIKEALK